MCASWVRQSSPRREARPELVGFPAGPSYTGCQRWVWTVFGDSSGPSFPAMVQ
jgi:hypothetical protein